MPRRDALSRGFGVPPTFYSELLVPSGAKETLDFIIHHTYGKRSVCPLSIKAIAVMLHRHRNTIALHLKFWEDLGQIRLERVRRGDSRAIRIVLCFRERDTDVRKAADKQIEVLPEKALSRWTMGDFRAELRGKKTVEPRRAVKEARGEYVA